MYLIVGLGNPGKQYENTRHNIGFTVIDRLSKDLNVEVTKGSCRALVGQGASPSGVKLVLAKPQTFMNLSGDSVLELMNWFKIENDHLIVIYDDLDLDAGKIRIRPTGNSGGHKGVESVISRLRTTDFIKIRIGISKPASNLLEEDASSYVLSKIPDEDRPLIDQAVVLASDAATVILSEGLEAAMNRYN